MIDEDHILTLAQWFSPGFPVSAFAYSHGLEQAIVAGSVADAKSLLGWVEDVLVSGSGWSDGLFLAAAFRAENDAEIMEIDATCRAYCATSERLLESVQQGKAFGATVAVIWGGDDLGLTYPVAVGRAARAQGLPLELTLAMYLQAFAANLVSVGMRLVPLGQTEGQALIRQLRPKCQDVAADAACGQLSALSGTAFLAEIAAMKHETQYSRVFRT